MTTVLFGSSNPDDKLGVQAQLARSIRRDRHADIQRERRRSRPLGRRSASPSEPPAASHTTTAEPCRAATTRDRRSVPFTAVLRLPAAATASSRLRRCSGDLPRIVGNKFGWNWDNPAAFASGGDRRPSARAGRSSTSSARRNRFRPAPARGVRGRARIRQRRNSAPRAHGARNYRQRRRGTSSIRTRYGMTDSCHAGPLAAEVSRTYPRASSFFDDRSVVPVIRPRSTVVDSLLEDLLAAFVAVGSRTSSSIVALASGTGQPAKQIRLEHRHSCSAVATSNGWPVTPLRQVIPRPVQRHGPPAWRPHQPCGAGAGFRTGICPFAALDRWEHLAGWLRKSDVGRGM